MIGRQPWIRQASRQAKDSFGRTCHYKPFGDWGVCRLTFYDFEFEMDSSQLKLLKHFLFGSEFFLDGTFPEWKWFQCHKSFWWLIITWTTFNVAENKWTDSWKMQNSTHFTYLSLISTTNKFCFFQNKIDKFFKCIPGTFSVKHFGFRHVLVVAIWFATILLSGSCLVNFSTAGWAVALGIRFFAARFCTLRR